MTPQRLELIRKQAEDVARGRVNKYFREGIGIAACVEYIPELIAEIERLQQPGPHATGSADGGRD